ncbi:MAG: cupin domain-containing protein [Saprospiraceae bacterium]|nr:cupin domain-containing protein [Saprospiraceae bacterium]
MNNTIDRTIVNPVSGEQVTFICTSAETNGLKSVIEIELQPNAEGPPLHYHKEYSETFRILEGEIFLQIGKEQKRARKGETFTVEKSQIHSFKNESAKPARVEVTLSPGHEGFENAISILFGLSKDGLVSAKGLPKKLINLAVINKLSDSHFTGVFSLVSSILKFVIKSHKMEMTQNELIDKYGRNFTNN